MESLERCKRCGNTEIEIDQDKDLWYVICGRVTCSTCTQNFEKKEDAILNWNMWNTKSDIKKPRV